MIAFRRKSGGLTDPQFALVIVIGVLLFHVVIIIVPLFYSFWLSLHETNVILRSSDYVGFDLWGQVLFEEETQTATLKSLYFAAISVVCSFVISLGMALVLNQEFPFRGVLRALILLPWAVSEVVTATMWTVMLEPSWGFFNGVLAPLGIVDEGHVWLNRDWALFWLSVAFSWHLAPLGTFFFLAAMQSIPKDLYNAARIDRAGVISRFYYVTLPHIRYAVLIVLVVVTVEAFRQFDLVFAMTSGGPGTTTQILPLLIFRYNFQFSQYGLASSASFILIIIATILAVAYFVLMTKRSPSKRIVKSVKMPEMAE
jgi:ABC-type sugar transport system permease subunit